MGPWPLWVQWALLLLVGGVFLGSSWWLALARARSEGADPQTLNERTRTFVGAFRFADWAMVALLVVFFVPLMIRTIAGT